MKWFRSTFALVVLATVLATGMVVAAFFVAERRPRSEVEQPSAALVRASGKCAECHRQETPAIVHEFEMSRHAAVGVNCLDCHRPAGTQEKVEHRGFVISRHPTAANCAECHTTQYAQFARSRHAAPAWAAVSGRRDFSPAQVAAGERDHPGWVDRPPNPLTALEGAAATERGCEACHAIGHPNPDGSLGGCTQCHGRHAASVAVAREPETCGQCHVGPDHSQIEIYEESKHGVLFRAQRAHLHLDAAPRSLSTADMPVPTCATCHMSGIEGAKMTHDTTERLSWFLFAAVSTRRPGYARAQVEMKEICRKCHASSSVEAYYEGAERVIAATNEKVAASEAIIEELRRDGRLGAAPFEAPIAFDEFDLWHYFGRTAKHGAFMGGADFVQWHGNYELLRRVQRIRAQADAMRSAGRVRTATTSAPPARKRGAHG